MSEPCTLAQGPDQITRLFDYSDDPGTDIRHDTRFCEQEPHFGRFALRHCSLLEPLSQLDHQLLAELKAGCDSKDWVWREIDRAFPAPRPAVDGFGKPRPPAIGAKDFIYAPRSHAWRIEAWHALKTAVEGVFWTETAERLEERIFDLPDEQIEARRLRRWERAAGFGCATNYAIVDRDYLSGLEMLNRRAFHAAVPANAVCFRPHARPRIDPAAAPIRQFIAPGGTAALIRFGTFWTADLPFQRHADLDILALSAVPVAELNRALKTDIHLYAAQGWAEPTRSAWAGKVTGSTVVC